MPSMWARALVAWELEEDIERRVLLWSVVDGQMIRSGAEI